MKIRELFPEKLFAGKAVFVTGSWNDSHRHPIATSGRTRVREVEATRICRSKASSAESVGRFSARRSVSS